MTAWWDSTANIRFEIKILSKLFIERQKELYSWWCSNYSIRNIHKKDKTTNTIIWIFFAIKLFINNSNPYFNY